MDIMVREQIRDFVKKQRMVKEDKVMEAMCAVEEANELVQAAMTAKGKKFTDYDVKDEREEVADVIITALIYAETSGFLDEVDYLVREKMMVNLDKPVRERVGVKVSKRSNTMVSTEELIPKADLVHMDDV